MQKRVIILIGPPGSGKDTQAELLAEKFGLVHIETAKIIEDKFKNAAPDDRELARAYQDYKSGKLVDPRLVAEWVIERIREKASQGKNLIFSGAFRTLHEAGQETPVVEELYGKEDIAVVYIELSEEESIKRNSTRRVCKANDHPIPNFPEYADLKTCPKDGSEIITRILDNPETIKVRYQTFLEQTKPVLDYFTQRGYAIVRVNGEQSIEAVRQDILKGIAS